MPYLNENSINCMFCGFCSYNSKVRYHKGTYYLLMDGKYKADIHPGMNVGIVLKQDQRSGKITQGKVKDILTNSSTHPHGIKVRLTDGQVGRVKQIL